MYKPRNFCFYSFLASVSFDFETRSMSTCMSTSRSNYIDMSTWKNHADHSTKYNVACLLAKVWLWVILLIHLLVVSVFLPLDGRDPGGDPGSTVGAGAWLSIICVIALTLKAKELSGFFASPEALRGTCGTSALAEVFGTPVLGSGPTLFRIIALAVNSRSSCNNSIAHDQWHDTRFWRLS